MVGWTMTFRLNILRRRLDRADDQRRVEGAGSRIF